MPILNYDKEFSDMPDLKQEQECDRCGLVVSGHLAYYSYEPKVSILCESCHLTTACTTDTATLCPFCDGAGWAYYTGDYKEDCHVCDGTGKA